MNFETAHILFIDDDIKIINEAKAWFIEIFGYQNLEITTSATAALEKLQEHFDVIVADMRMEQDSSGFKILNYVQYHTLSSVVIIFTANDTVADCREAFRRGTWDYISKNMRGNTFEILHESIKDALTYIERWGNQLNDQWFQAHKAELEADYWGQYIAILNQAVIESADTQAKLEKRLDERQLRHFTTTIKPVGDLRSIADLLQGEARDTLEFKRSFCWNGQEDGEDRDLILETLQTIAAFLNSDGGALLLGVANDRQLFGLNQDYPCLGRSYPDLAKARDQFQRYLMDQVENHIGKQFTPYLKIRFEQIEEKDLCAVYVRKADRLALLKESKNSKTLALYTRVGNSSRPQTVPEIYNWLT
jgi:FixJ family two-component response regulator